MELLELRFSQKQNGLQRETETKLQEFGSKLEQLKQSKVVVNVGHQIVQPLTVNQAPIEQPQPDERITQAEYEKVVKGARLTDPVEEPISRSCPNCIFSVSMYGNKPAYACEDHIHSIDEVKSQTVIRDRNCTI